MLFINFEGIDHSFKETNSNKLMNYLLEKGYKVVKYEFPDYTTENGKQLYKALHGEIKMSREELFKLFYYNKMANVRNITEMRAINDDDFILITDRFKYSNLAYNYDLRNESYYNLEKNLPEPDMTIYMDMNPELIKDLVYERARAKGEEPDMNEINIDLLNNVYKAYKEVLKDVPHKVIKCWNNDTILSETDIFDKQIVPFVDKFVKKTRTKNLFLNILNTFSRKDSEKIELEINPNQSNSNPSITVKLINVTNDFSQLYDMKTESKSVFDYNNYIESLKDSKLRYFTDFYFELSNMEDKHMKDLFKLINSANVKYYINEDKVYLACDTKDIIDIFNTYMDNDTEVFNKFKEAIYESVFRDYLTELINDNILRYKYFINDIPEEPYSYEATVYEELNSIRYIDNSNIYLLNLPHNKRDDIEGLRLIYPPVLCVKNFMYIPIDKISELPKRIYKGENYTYIKYKNLEDLIEYINLYNDYREELIQNLEDKYGMNLSYITDKRYKLDLISNPDLYTEIIDE